MAPVAIDHDGLGARFLSVGEDRQVIELRTRLEADEVEVIGELPDEGPRYFHSLVATDVDGLVGALWVQEPGLVDEGQVVVAMLDRGLVPIAPPLRIETVGTTYSPRMRALHCEGRFVGFYYDRAGAHVVQLDMSGRQLGETHTYGVRSDSGWIDAVCLNGGVVLSEWDQMATLSCR